MSSPPPNDIVPPEDPRHLPRYAGWTTFARLPRLDDLDGADIAVVGVPFDSAVTYRPGARFAPNAIRAASRLVRGYNPALDVRPFEACQAADAGDVSCSPFDIGAAMTQIEGALSGFVNRDTKLVVLGGDHSIALPSLRAVHARHGPVALIHFDAHLDTWDTYFGSDVTHGTPFRRAFEEGLLLRERSIHVGIRGSLYDDTDLRKDAEMGFSTIHCRDVDRLGMPAVIDHVVERVGDARVYVSIDIDVLDPAHAPGTGTPESGGLTSRELLEAVRRIGALDVVGCDVVEVSPAYDHAEITAMAAANVTWEMLSSYAKKVTR